MCSCKSPDWAHDVGFSSVVLDKHRLGLVSAEVSVLAEYFFVVQLGDRGKTVEPLGKARLRSTELSQTAAVRFKAERHLKYRQLITESPGAEALGNWVNQSANLPGDSLKPGVGKL